MAALGQAAKEALILILKPFMLLAGLAIYGFLRALAPRRRIRFGILPYERIGHMAGNTEHYLRRRAAGLEDARDVPILLTGTPANRALLDVLRRRITIVESRVLRSFYNHGLKPWTQGTPFELVLGTADEYTDFNRTGPQIALSPEEDERGRRLLASLGIPADAPFVCMHARGKNFLSRSFSDNDWSYHDYRDCDERDYLEAARFLADKGLYVVRMGASVEGPLDTGHPRIVDYAGRQRSDFGDVYLTARCRFFLGSTAGLVCLAYCFGVPVAAANFTPLAYAPWGPKDIFIPKKYRDRKSGRLIPYPEMIRRGADAWLEGQNYAAAGIEVVANAPGDIRALAEEMVGRLEDSFAPIPEDERLEASFRAMFPAGHRITGFKSRPCAAFLRANADLLHQEETSWESGHKR